MASYINVDVTLGTKTSSGQSYTCTVTTDKVSYFGMSPSSKAIGIIDHNGTCLNYIGWPKASSWKSSWGSPAYALQHGSSINGPFGTANGMLLQNYSYTFSGTVSLDRTNKRKATKTISIGVKTSKDTEKFPTVLKEITFETLEIPESKFEETTLNYSVDSPNTSGVRYIRLSATFKNPEGFYTAKIYSNSGTMLAVSSANATSVSCNVKVTEDMYQTKPVFKATLWGKDGSQYSTISTPSNTYIEPSGAGVTVKNSGIHSVSRTAFRNVTNKEIKEVWIKIDGKIYKTKK